MLCFTEMWKESGLQGSAITKVASVNLTGLNPCTFIQRGTYLFDLKLFSLKNPASFSVQKEQDLSHGQVLNPLLSCYYFLCDEGIVVLCYWVATETLRNSGKNIYLF